MDNLCNNWTIRPAKRLKVRGMRTVGLTSMSTPRAVWIYICNIPALFTGESSKVRRHCSCLASISQSSRQIKSIEANLMSDIWASVTDVSIHFAHNSNMLITVQQRVFPFVSHMTCPARVGSFVCFEACIREDNNQSLGVLVGGRYRDMLLSVKFWKLWGRTRLAVP